jgi:hypothetical protein
LTRDEEPLLARLADTAIGNDWRAARGDSSGDSSDDSAADSAADAESDTVLFTWLTAGGAGAESASERRIASSSSASSI